jgi:predicted phage baseplate assembly protein
VFGSNPDAGWQFTATYRYGAGVDGNVAADAISQLDAAALAHGLVAVSNPQAATGGADAETLQSVRRLAPQKFRAEKLRAVLAQDYADAAVTLPWVKRAGTVFRWTGSWRTTFTTPEPIASEQIAIGDRVALVALLNRYRMAGTESYVPDPDYVSIDLVVELCAMADAFAAGVMAAVTTALSPTGPGATAAFFAVSRFVFGQPLERSALEAAIQAVPGVAGVTCIRFRLRDRTAGFDEMKDIVAVGASEIIRCDNDPSRPNNGSLAVVVRGGR